jgi:hypothetical protein
LVKFFRDEYLISSLIMENGESYNKIRIYHFNLVLAPRFRKKGGGK